MERKAGILMPVSALPTPYYIGDFGPSAYRFAEKIRKAGFSLWQILPLNPVGYGNSPYQCLSSKAIDANYVSIDLLYDEGLIKKKPQKVYTDVIDYQKARKLKREVLEEAFANFRKDREYENFVNDNDWVFDYAVFVSFKEANDEKCWTEWEKQTKDYALTRDEEVVEKHRKAIDYHLFEQYILYRQFKAWKNYVNSLGIEVMGDLPIYVGLDSDDVYYNRDYFELYDDGRPQWIAGVPPDAFSDEGQRWGNPLYKWELMRENDFEWWFDRLHYSSELYDILRIDHFRAFDTYWKISAEEPTAKVGEWVINSGDEFFGKLFKKYPDIRIIAEDLGEMRDEVFELRDKYKLRGMRILHYEMLDEGDGYKIAYIGTHDNDTLLNWYDSQDRKYKTAIRKLVHRKFPHRNTYNGILELALSQNNELVVISATDVILGRQKINSPGTIGEPNWTFKFRDYRVFNRRLKMMKEMIMAQGRYR